MAYTVKPLFPELARTDVLSQMGDDDPIKAGLFKSVLESLLVSLRQFADDLTFDGVLLADGTIDGAVNEAQDFGTEGIETDLIAESTEGEGVDIGEVPREWYDLTYAHRIPVTIPANQQTYNLYSGYLDLSEFPSVFWDNVKNGGGDIRVTKADGVTERARDVVFCDTGTNTGELRIKTNTTLYPSMVDETYWIYFGNAAADDYVRADTYSFEGAQKNSARAVYHFQNNSFISSAYSDDENDTLTNSGTTNTDGMFDGDGRAFDGASYLYSSTWLDPYYLTGTLGLWYKPTNVVGVQTLVSIGSGAGASGNFLLIQQSGSSVVFSIYYDDGGGGEYKTLTAAGVLEAGVWVSIDVAHSGSGGDGNSALFINSVKKASMVFGKDDSGAHTYINIGRNSNGTQYVTGVIDEFYYTTGVVGAPVNNSEIAQWYRNDTNPLHFWAIEEAEAV